MCTAMYLSWVFWYELIWYWCYKELCLLVASSDMACSAYTYNISNNFKVKSKHLAQIWTFSAVTVFDCHMTESTIPRHQTEIRPSRPSCKFHRRGWHQLHQGWQLSSLLISCSHVHMVVTMAMTWVMLIGWFGHSVPCSDLNYAKHFVYICMYVVSHTFDKQWHRHGQWMHVYLHIRNY